MANVTIERAAGGVVVRVRDGELQVLLIDDRYGRVSFPKGHLEPGESWEVAAIREVEEETGISARIIGSLGRLEYPIERAGRPIRKQVRLYLMEAVDSEIEPTAQLEELPGAYFMPWRDGVARHEEGGYDNWSWALEKAAALWNWHQLQGDTSWHNHDASADVTTWYRDWSRLLPDLDTLIDAVRMELESVAPHLAGAIPPKGERIVLPKPTADNGAEAVRAAIEHTLLKPEASVVDIENLCREAVQYRFHAVCVNPQHVRTASECLAGTDVAVCTVVGFPLGAADVAALAAETEAVIAAGATEVDMVIPIGSMREDDIWTVYDHVRAVTDAAAVKPGVIVKAILETAYLTTGQIVKACAAAVAAGAHLVKTSTGFAARGARLADVATMARAVGHRAPVKAAGGIKSRSAATAFIQYGATRIGTSSGVAMMREERPSQA